MKSCYEAQVMWSQMDINQHLRHSAYADFAAQARLNMLEAVGLNISQLAEAKIGPVIFREELRYLREVRIGEMIKVNCEVNSSRADGSRWSVRHELIRSDGITAAIIIAEGAWMDTEKRKLTTLPPQMIQMFLQLPRSEDYQETPASSKST